MPKKRGVKQASNIVINAASKFEKNLKNLSDHELKELLLIHMYKNALLRAQLEAITNVLIKKNLTTYEEIWKETNENFKNTI
jgi:hypothetical protein